MDKYTDSDGKVSCLLVKIAKSEIHELSKKHESHRPELTHPGKKFSQGTKSNIIFERH